MWPNFRFPTRVVLNRAIWEYEKDLTCSDWVENVLGKEQMLEDKK